MDLKLPTLARLMRFSRRYRSIREYLGDVLEGERSLIEAETPKAQEFTVKDGVGRLLETTSVSQPTVVDTFTRLAPYFEAGFLLIPGRGLRSELKSMFIFGRVFTPENEKDRVDVELRLPRDFGTDRVFSGRVNPVLKALRLESISALHGAQAFAFRPSREAVFILLCDRPHLWQVQAIEDAYAYVDELLGPAK